MGKRISSLFNMIHMYLRWEASLVGILIGMYFLDSQVPRPGHRHLTRKENIVAEIKASLKEAGISCFMASWPQLGLCVLLGGLFSTVLILNPVEDHLVLGGGDIAWS